MFFIDIANPIILLVSLFITVCFVYIGKESKNAYVPLIALVAFLVLLLMHGMQLIFLPQTYATMSTDIARCLIVDFLMVFLTYASYLWIDDVETKAKKKKSIDSSLEWFWKNV